LTKEFGGRVEHRYAARGGELRGFSVTRMSDSRARALSRDGGVKYVEQAARVQRAWVRKSPGWALDLIDQRETALSGDYRYSADGSGVHVYVLDTGILADPPEFFSQRAPIQSFDATSSGTATPCDRHGTAIASLIAGNTVGVAPGADLVDVKVFDCN